MLIIERHRGIFVKEQAGPAERAGISHGLICSSKCEHPWTIFRIYWNNMFFSPQKFTTLELEESRLKVWNVQLREGADETELTCFVHQDWEPWAGKQLQNDSGTVKWELLSMCWYQMGIEAEFTVKTGYLRPSSLSSKSTLSCTNKGNT